MTKGYDASSSAALPSGSQLIAMGSFVGMAFLSIAELAVLIAVKFRRRSGLYFWSMVAGLVGAFMFNLGFLLYFFALGDRMPAVTAVLLDVGYLIYLPAEFTVLYSRLHLLSASRKMLRLVLVLMVANIVLVAIPLVVLATGSQVTSSTAFSEISGIYQRLEVCTYATSSFTLSGLYILQVTRSWRSSLANDTKRLLKHLVLTNVFVMCLHIVNIAMEFAGFYGLENVWLGFMYIFQLKLEFWILNRLTAMSKVNLNESQAQFTVQEEESATGTVRTRKPESTVD